MESPGVSLLRTPTRASEFIATNILPRNIITLATNLTLLSLSINLDLPIEAVTSVDN